MNLSQEFRFRDAVYIFVILLDFTHRLLAGNSGRLLFDPLIDNSHVTRRIPSAYGEYRFCRLGRSPLTSDKVLPLCCPGLVNRQVYLFALTAKTDDEISLCTLSVSSEI